MALAIVVAGLGPSPAAHANSKYSGIVVDAKTGKVLYANSAHTRRYPASLTKIMTLYILFQELEAGRVTLDTPFKASAHSAGQAPSKVGLRAGQTIKVRDAIGTLVTKSANDVAATVGENISGSEPAFARRMTATAKRLGMKHTQFRNASGLPAKGQYTTAADMALLGRAIQERFPSYYKYFSTRVYTYRGRRYGNHNRLLGKVKGVDGIKTGYIRASGFNLVASVRDKGRHIVAVVMGGRTGRSRDKQMRRLIARYMPKASNGPHTAPLIASRTPLIAGRAPLPPVKPNGEPILIAKVEVPLPPVTADAPAAAVPLPPATVGHGPITTGELGPVQISEGDADESSSIETTNVLPTPKAITAAIARAHAMTNPKAVAAAVAAKTEPAPSPIKTAALAPPKQQARPTGWHIQIAAVESKADAMRMLQEARAAAAPALKGRSTYTEEIHSNGDTLYRARFVGFKSRSAATAACKKLQKTKYDGCYATH